MNNYDVPRVTIVIISQFFSLVFHFFSTLFNLLQRLNSVHCDGKFPQCLITYLVNTAFFKV